MSSKKKIIFISHGLKIGGAEKFLISLANSLCSDFEITILAISSGNELLNELSKKVKYIEIKRKSKFDLKTILTLRKYLKQNTESIICNMDFFCFIYYRMANIFCKNSSPLFISYHSTILKNFKENFLTWIYTRFLRKSDKILTVSENQALYTSKKFKIKINQFLSIHNGIDVKKWIESNDQDYKNFIRNKYSIPLNSKLIVITAALRLEKNHEMAIKALSHLHNYHANKAYLLIVGGGTLLNEIKNEVANCKLNDYVIFTGSQNNVKPFYFASDIFSLTSFSETFSIAVLEAMACGLPCVITNVGGANEMVINGFNGYLSEVNEISMAENWDKALHQKFSENDIQNYTLENFNLEKMVNKYKLVFKQKN